MFLTAKQAIRHIALQLPHTTHSFLYGQRIRELAHLLELINADDNINEVHKFVDHNFVNFMHFYLFYAALKT